ncbi:hypothetical protein [Aeoliella mucimassa]|uniref:Uncharacterized protein n=1 Tax=Aeoliella mucimassa TaxID=2527972 RepID=A0A518AVS9_9BACT|nr:hypothetical protein [Aeoliella mucimassa]QDU58835.1 hypothetical protein Pan181_50750 [Aeoliella mucimassa]
MMAVSILGLLLLLGVLITGLVLFVIGLSNRHTRGATIAVASLLAIAVVAIVGWTYASYQQTEVQAYAMEQAQMMEAQSQELRAMAAQMEMTGEADSQQLAEAYRRQAESLVEQAHNQAAIAMPSAQAHMGSSSSQFRLSWSVVILAIVFLAIVSKLLKRSGPVVGLTALAIMAILFVVSFRASTPRAVSMSGTMSTSTHRSEHGSPLFSDDVHDQQFGPRITIETTTIASNDSEVTEPQENSPSEDKAETEKPETGESADTNVATESPAEESSNETSEAVEESQPAAATWPTPETTSTEEHDSDFDPIGPSPSMTPLPEWVSSPPKSVENVHRLVIESSWYSTPQGCNEQAEGVIQDAVISYLQDEVAGEAHGTTFVPTLERLGINNRYIRDNIVSDRFYETRDFDLEHQKYMTNLHVLLEFDDHTTQDMLNRWRDYARQENVALVGLSMAGVLASLAGVLGLIKLDTYTKGYYSKRLFIGVPAAIIGIVVFVILANI